MAKNPRDRISEATKNAEHRDAQARPGAPQVPTAAESEAADEHGSAMRSTEEGYEEMLERGAHQRGEGRLP